MNNIHKTSKIIPQIAFPKIPLSKNDQQSTTLNYNKYYGAEIKSPKSIDLSKIYSFNIPYISPWDYLFSSNKLPIQANQFSVSKRKNWDTYPIYLKHTILYHDSVFEATRLLAFPKRVPLIDRIKKESRASMKKGDYCNALTKLEQALSLIKWLKYEGSSKEMPTSKPLTFLIINFDDQNITLNDGEEITEKTEKNLRDRIFVELLSEITDCYIKMSHFELAKETVKDAEKIYIDHPLTFFCKAKIVAYNAESSQEDCKQMLHKINETQFLTKKSIQSSQFLKAVLDQRIAEFQLAISKDYNLVLQKSKDLLIKPQKFIVNAIKEEISTKEIIYKEIIEKYKKIFEKGSFSDDKLNLLKQEYQTLKINYTVFHKYINLQPKEEMTKKLLDAFEIVKLQKAKAIFDNLNFNFEIYQLVVLQYISKQKEFDQLLKHLNKQNSMRKRVSILFEQLKHHPIEISLQIFVLMLIMSAFFLLISKNFSLIDF